MQKISPARRRKKWKARLRLALAAGCLCLFFWGLDRQLRPVICTMASSQCRIAATLAINRALEEELERNAPLYEKMYQIQYGPDGAVAAVWTDSAAVNQAKASLTAAVLEQMDQLEQQNIAIPLGTLLGWQLLAGRGPEVTMRAVPTGFASSEFTTRLESAGVNQTLLMGCIDFHLEISAILPGFSSTETVRDEVCVFQTLVVGEVPQVYASMEQNPAQ